MKKLLLSIVSVFMFFALSAQISDDFSDYTVGGKLAQQAQAMGRDYWTTWSNVPGGPEDGVIAEMPAGNKALFLNYGHDQLMWCGQKETGAWMITFDIYIPAGKDAYFNVQADFTGDQDGTWAFECYLGRTKQSTTFTSGSGNFYAGSATGVPFNFTHDTWIPIKVMIDLDNDNAEFYFNNALTHTWLYTSGNNGSGGCPRVIDAFNLFPPTSSARSSFYVDNVSFNPAPIILYETSFDDVANGAKVAQSYPLWWDTWSNAPGGSEDATISNEQSSSTPQSAKLVYGNDLIFKSGDQTSGIYTVDFELYIPGDVPAYFNGLQISDGDDSQWAFDCFFNMKSNPYQLPIGTYLMVADEIIHFTLPPLNTWISIKVYVDLDEDYATIYINGEQIHEWIYSIDVNGDQGTRQFAGIDFWPPLASSVYYIDNFVFTAYSTGDTYPIMNVTPDEIDEMIVPGGTINKTISVENSGTSIGDYASWIVYDFEPTTGTDIDVIGYSTEDPKWSVGYDLPEPRVIELAARLPSNYICSKVGTYINKLAYFLSDEVGSNSLDFRIYGPGTGSKPGEILREITKTVSADDLEWVEATLSEPFLLDGTEIWISVRFEHLVNTGAYYPISTDNTENAVPGCNWMRWKDGAWFQMVSSTPGTTYGNFMVRGMTEGKAISSCWLNLAGENFGSVPKGATKTFDAVLKATGLDEGVYTANVFVRTSDTDNPLVTIPCKLTVVSSSSMSVSKLEIVEIINDSLPITVQVKITNNGNISGDYTIEEAEVDWLSFSKTAGTIDAGKNDTFDVTLNADGLENGKDYVTDIIIKTTDLINNTIKIPCTMMVRIPQGVNVHSIKTFVFPNPATNNVTVQSTHLINSVQIINFLGQPVISSNVNKNQTTISTANLSAGIYFLKVNTDAGSQNLKLIIK